MNRREIKRLIFSYSLLISFAGFFLGFTQNFTLADSPMDNIHNPYNEQNWDEEQKEVWQTIEKWNHAFSQNDPDTYFTYIADEITLLLPSGPYRVEGKPDDMQEFEFLLGKGFTKVGFFQEMQPQVTVIGNMAFVSYYSRGYYGEPDGQMASFKETTILKKTSEGWKIIHIHLSR